MPSRAQLSPVIGSAIDEPKSGFEDGGCSFDEAQQLLGGVSRSHTYRLINAREILSAHVGRRRVICRRSVREYLRRSASI